MSEDEIPVRMSQMRYEADTIISAELETLDESCLPKAAPGAHVDMMLSDDLRRRYSLALRENWAEARSAPLLSTAIRIVRGSAFVHDTLRVGDKIRITRPKNKFPLDKTPIFSF